jgi:RND family efflux transporter MFP subunit
MGECQLRRVPVVMIAAAVFTAFAAGAALAQQRSVAPVRGLVRALNQASIGIDFAVPVEKLHVREAESFHKGDPLVTFDCRRMRAEYSAAAATSREMKLTLQSQSYLDARGAAGKLDVEISKARADKAEADASAIAARLDQCRIVAPFDGRVTELKINEHEVPGVGQPFISLVDETAFEVDLLLPSYALKAVEPGSPFKFQIDETGRIYDAQVLRLGAAVDPVSQSIKAIGRFVSSDGQIVAGMSGTAVVPAMEAIR